ncbi:murein biosynthesis integral membrane protein MurJ [Cerasicoccus maritimus]|uniref:murein biosynthesis integral membrane protein MurJ n=1 Tax=Cerasicoccus maritimus TaxID=490089 RepID=UPI0028525D6C|nr:murein biosynthesis integral membrane protein MurJ [Cerasicoccus maritimus]
MSQRLKSMITVSISVMGSRVLGLLRDALTAAFLGVSLASNAFIFAFMLPNLFRRMFGEGALTSAFVPVLSDHTKDGDDARAFRFVNQILLRLAVLTIGLTVLLCLGFYGADLVLLHLYGADNFAAKPIAEQWTLGARLSILMMPYMPIICLTAILGAVLNVRNRFAVPALSNVLLNIGIIAALLIGGLQMKLPKDELVFLLGVGVLVGGAMQLLTAMWALWREGWRPRLERGPVEGMDELKRLFIPGLWGAAILQINILVSRVLAFGLDDTATTTLNYANRLVELPMGIFAVAIATVIFPQMSLMAAAEDRDGLVESYGHGLRMTLALTAPAAVGLIVLSEPIIATLFQWGRFSAGDVSLTSPLLMILAGAMPLFAVSTFMTRGFHAFKDTKTPVKFAFLAFLINAGCGAALMIPLGAKGLALGNLLSSLAFAVCLGRGIVKKRPELAGIRLWKAAGKILLASIGMAAVALSLLTMIYMIMGPGKHAAFVSCGVIIPVGAGMYFAILVGLKFEDSAEILKLLKRFVKRG